MLDFKKIEEEVLKFWKSKKIYDKVRKKNKNGKKFYFLQGPPYTSGKLHIGHAWNNSLKDVAMRFKRMQGMDVWDRAGYDMHGLPTENAVQKELKLRTKDEILSYGMDKFIKKCMDFSMTHAKYMNQDLLRLGIWMDFENAYMPVKKEFISGQWKFFKKAEEQSRLYKGMKVMHWDAETETSLAKHELEYKTIKEQSIFLKFKIRDKKNEYFIIWTTTPWTIAYNLGIMVNPDLDYVKIKVGAENWILAKDLVESFMKLVGKKYKIVEKIKGKKLEGQEYEHFLQDDIPAFKKLKKKYKKIHTIMLSKQYVDTSSGSGLVHCAPGCGPEDEEVGRQYGIQGFNDLNERGEFTQGKFKGWKAKVDDDKFIDYFKKKGNLVAISEVEHEYPHSWRSHKPVIFRTTEQWFLKTENLVPKLLNFNKKVNWQPEKAGESYNRWAENLRDNSVTRQRFWGCPVPIWVNQEDNKDYIVIGSVEELEKLTKKRFNDLSLHKPWIDQIVIKKSGKKYKRIEDVCDVWLDSGTVSWNCLYNDKKLIKKYFPADLVLEATEQTRLWFSLLQICSSIVFNKSCYNNVYVHGMILDFQGMKMSKSLGNIISPYEVVNKFSGDIFRYYICGITAGENINFSWEDIKQKRRNLLVLMNIQNYINDLLQQEKLGKVKDRKFDLEERYILSRTNSTLKKVTELFENYQLDKTIDEIEKLFLDLSRVYIKLTRNKANNDKKRRIVLLSCYYCYIRCLKMFSPICPLITEHLWQKIKKGTDLEESVHLCGWPKVESKFVDEKIEKEFSIALQIIEAGLAARSDAKIGLKWPLGKATIKTEKKINKKLQEIIARQINVKKLVVKKGKLSVKLDTKMTKELEKEGYAREIARKVQAARKKVNLVKTDKIDLAIETNLSLKKQEKFIKERTNAAKIKILKSFAGKKYKNSFEAKIKGKKIKILFTKL